MDPFQIAQAQYGAIGVDAEVAIRTALSVPISVHCWQADDVAGFEVHEGPVDSGGILATGTYPGRARNPDELRQDYDKVLSLVPGVCRANLHAIYAETGGKAVPRDELTAREFSGWIGWAKERGIGLDFNPTYFAHPLATSGFTLSSADPEVRAFWIRHGIASRRIAAGIAEALGAPCVNNHWIPDGAKDSPANRWAPRERLISALDDVLAAPLSAPGSANAKPLSPAREVGDRRDSSTARGGGGEGARERERQRRVGEGDEATSKESANGCVDAVESKLFGIGSEDYVVGSFEFYSHYALTRKKLLCLDMGHFHPTETTADKLSALLQFHDGLLLHLSRPMRWDSDHVVLFNDDLRAVFQELVRGDALGRVSVALDYFDASINRIAAYVIGIRAARKAILYALLEPVQELQKLESEGRLAEKLALMEEVKTLPFGTIWDELCCRADVPYGAGWVTEAGEYERQVLSKRA